MKKLIMMIALSLTASLHLFAEERKDDQTLKVLIIGNSFSICALEHTPKIAENLGKKIDMASLYIGGCSLERHWKNVLGANKPDFKPYRLDRETLGKNVVRDGRTNIPEMLKAEKWDVVTIQQVSSKGFVEKSFYPFGDNLVEFIRKEQPNAKIYFQEVWGYPSWDKRLSSYRMGHIDMYVKHRTVSQAFAKKHGIEVIPTGTAAAYVSDRNSLFPRGDFHFNSIGTYLQGLVWAAKLLNCDVTKCTYKPAKLDQDRADELKDAASKAVFGAPEVRRAFRERRVTRGNTNIIALQPADEASWIWHPTEKGVVFLKFRNVFTVEEGDGPLLFDVTADERFHLEIDGKFIARGPNRSNVNNWQYLTYVAELKPGKHVVEATVWTIGDLGPLAQLSYQGGFLFKASGAYDAKLTTGKGIWQVGKIDNIRSIGNAAGAWGTGCQFEITGSGPYASEPKSWENAKVVRDRVDPGGYSIYGIRTKGWMLFPSTLPDQMNVRRLPGRVKAVAKNVEFKSKHAFTPEEAKETIDLSKPFTVPARTKMQIAWDLEKYYCAYPHVILSGGKGAKFSFCFAEASHRSDNNLKTSVPGARGLIENRYLPAYGDVFVSDGRKGAEFSAPWFRCGKWVKIDIETQDEPLTVDSIAIYETRYPLEMESSFVSAQDDTLSAIRLISARAMQMCCHEMLFDCPFYEQQMYPGDTRVQLNVISAMTRDDRIIKRAIELYGFNTHEDGMCPFNFPTRGHQDGASYTLCYLLMYGDYMKNHGDRAWLKARLPGIRNTMAGMEYYENKDGLLENIPGWSFVDWTVGWSHNGVPPSAGLNRGVSSIINLFWNLAMKSTAAVERALGNELQAKYWEEKSKKLSKKIDELFWSEKMGMLADDVKKSHFSEHAQSLALIGDVLPGDKAAKAFEGLITNEKLKRCTVYFSYYLFETYFKFGRGDLFLKRLDLWRDYVKKGLTTTQEAPDKGKNESRSDCHAWGAHPIWFMQTGLAGIKSDGEFFSKVLVSPSPGSLKEISAKHPHHKGWIEVDLKFDGDKATGVVKTPVPGTFKFKGMSVDLIAGENIIK